jgi:O-antigen ligase
LAYLIGVGISLGWLMRNLHVKWRRWMGIGFVVFLAYSTMLTGSRAGLIGLLITTSCTPFLLWRTPIGRSILIPLALAVVSLAVFMPKVMIERAQDIPSLQQGLEEEEARRTRIHQYRLAFQLINESPLLGIGPNEFSRVYSQKVEGDIRRSLHSWYLKIAVDGGILALSVFLLLFLVTLFSGLQGAFRGSTPELQHEGWALAFLVIGLMVFGTVSSVPYSKLLWLVFSLGAVEMKIHRLEKGHRDDALNSQERAVIPSAAGNTVVVVKKD